jgi:hypothetical protein
MPVRIAVRASRYGLDVTDLDLDRDEERDRAPSATTFGVKSASPTTARSIALKIGFRTRRNGPAVTSAVRSVASTPTRHESPMPSCAHSVSAMPAKPSANPNAWTSGPSRATAGATRPAS